MKKVTKENSILYNQLWINKAIEEGHFDFLPSEKPNKCIGEYIEEQYILSGELQQIKKITKKESIIFNREWKIKAMSEGIKIPTKRVSDIYSIGEMLEIKYLERELQKEINHPEKTLLLSGENSSKKRALRR